MADRRYATSGPSRPPAVSPTPGRWRRLTGRFLVVLATALVGSCSWTGVLDPQGPIAAQQLLLLYNATGIMLVVVIPVILMTLVFAWWYRSSNERADHSPDWAYQGGVELVVWSIPALVVILLGGVNWIGSHQLDPRSPIPSDAKPLRVEVVSLDWKWLFIYPDQGIATVNQLTVPAGTPLNFRLTSATVMNAFFVPQLGSMIYTMGGMVSGVNLLADHPGSYQGLSAQFSGDGFSDMRFMVTAVAAGEFDAWVAKARASGKPLDDKAYEELAKPSHAVPPAIFPSVDPKLFDRIVDQTAGRGDKPKIGEAWCPPEQRAGG